MADTKITALTALTGADPANDVIPIVDVSDTTMAASGTTKKISVNNILGASGTATLASATITGGLTIGGATSFPAGIINTSGGNPVFAPTAATNFLYTGSTSLSIRNQANTQEIFNLTPAGVYTFGDGAGGTRMTLNSTGLGVGVAPGYPLHVQRATAGPTAWLANSTTYSQLKMVSSGTNQPVYVTLNPTGTGAAIFQISDVDRLTIDTSGNVGIGVTPSAWFSNYKALQVNATASVSGFSSGSNQNTRIANNWFSNAAGTDTYIQSNFATVYQQNQGVHSWLTAPSGTAGNAITFTQAMTLDSGGNLLVGLTGGNNRVQIAGNIGLPNSCTASGETSGVFSIDVANLLTLNGANWRQASILLVYTGVDTNLGNSTVLQTVVNLQGLSTWNTISKNDIVGTASVAVSNDTTTGARITVTVPAGNSGTAYAVLLGGAGASTRPSMTINP